MLRSECEAYAFFAGAFVSPYTRYMDFTIRDARSDDLDAVLSLNEAVVPAVNSITLDEMRWFAGNAAYFRVAADDARIAAFLIGLRPGIDYESPNYRWFCKRYEDFGYIDRVAVDPGVRRSGLASKLYDDFRESLPGSVKVMTCEVNIRPPNESSMRFHERYGFERIATQQTEGGSKEVALMVRCL